MVCGGGEGGVFIGCWRLEEGGGGLLVAGGLIRQRIIRGETEEDRRERERERERERWG